MGVCRISECHCVGVAAALLAIAGEVGAADNVPAPLITVNDNGAWSWFEDERAIVDAAAGKLVVSTIANGAGFGGASRAGDVEVVSVDLTTHANTFFQLRDAFPADDHNTPALYRRPDGRYLAMYAAHGTDNFSRWRVSVIDENHPAGDVSAWTNEQMHNNTAGATYSNLHYLPGDNGGAGRLYNFVRSIGFDPNILVSSDQGSTWTYGGRLLTEGTSSDRPYLRYASDGTRIHVFATDRHPRDFNNSIYHGYVQDGVLYNSAGGVVDANLFDATAQAPSAMTTVFAANTVVDGVSMQRGWTVDAAIDDAGRPVGVFQMRAGGSDLDHRYLYNRWDGAQWQVKRLGYAGSYLYAAENDYTGLVSIDPDDVNTVYLSSEVHPATQAQLFGADGQRHHELFRGRTQDGGDSWAWTPITFNSRVDNLRPHVPRWNDDHVALVWLRGDYSTYTSYNLKVVALLDPPLTEPVHALSVDFGATGQQVQSGSMAFTRDQNPAGTSQTEMYSSPLAGPGGQIAVTVGGGDVQFRDRGDDVAGPLGDLADDFVFNAGELTLTLGNLQAGDYQIVLYGHDRDSTQSAFRIMLDGDQLGLMTPTNGAAPQIGIASSRVQFHASGTSVTLSLESLTAANVVLNGFELYSAPAYVSPPPVDLNADGTLDLADFLQYIAGMHKEFAGMSASDAYSMGDINGDLKNNYDDLLLFRQAYNQFNGAGALEAALSVPEPTAAGLLTLGMLLDVARRRALAGNSGWQFVGRQR